MGFITECVFCGRQAVSKNQQNFPVCVVHKKEEFPDMKCVCGGFLTVKEGKYGSFFLCGECGPISVKKAIEMNNISPNHEKKAREITMRSDEVDLF